MDEWYLKKLQSVTRTKANTASSISHSEWWRSLARPILFNSLRDAVQPSVLEISTLVKRFVSAFDHERSLQILGLSLFTSWPHCGCSVPLGTAFLA